jgi:hypothetical protein
MRRARWVISRLARTSPGAARPHSLAAWFSAPPRYPPSTGTASPASRPMPTVRGSVGSARVSSTNRSWASTAARIACRGEVNTARASSPRSSMTDPPRASTDSLATLANFAGELGRGLVASLLGEHGVATNVGDQERPDLVGFVLGGTRDTASARSRSERSTAPPIQAVNGHSQYRRGRRRTPDHHPSPFALVRARAYRRGARLLLSGRYRGAGIRRASLVRIAEGA